MSRQSSRIVSYEQDVNPTISQVRLSFLRPFESIPEAATPVTPQTAEYRRNVVADRLRRNEDAILRDIETRLRARLAPRA